MNIIYSVIFFSSVFFADGYSYDNGTLKCLNETIGQTFPVPELNNNYTKVNNLMFDTYKTNNQYNKFALSCTTGITNMSNLFRDQVAFNSNISTWDTSSVEDMYSMFGGTEAFNQDISNWDTSSVTDMNSMFFGALFNRDISKWDTSKVRDMDYMFYSEYNFNQDLTNWCANITEPTDFVYSFISNLNASFYPLWNGIGCTHKCYNGAIRNITDTENYSCICNGDFVGLYCNHTITTTPTTTSTTLSTTTATTTLITTTTPAPVIFTVPVIIGSVCGGIVLVAGLGYLVKMFVFKITTQTRYILQTVTPTEL